MVELSISFKTATRKTNLKHNNRTLSDKEKKMDAHRHVDFSKSDQNIYIKQQSLEDAYDELFGEAVQKYNAKQKRKDRKIDNYLQKVKKDKKLDVQREFVVQLGDVDLFRESSLTSSQGAQGNRQLFGELLTDYVDDFQRRNPNLHVYNAVVHLDETSPHLHLNVIPVATGYKRGLEVQPSFSKALANQGVTSTGKHQYIDFRNQEVAELEQILNSVGAERKRVGTNSFEDMNEFKAYQRKIDELNKENQALEEQKVEITQEVSVLKQEKSKLEIETADRKKELESLPDIEREKAKIDAEIERFTFAKFKEKFFDFARQARKGTTRIRDVVVEEVSRKLTGNYAQFVNPIAWEKELERQELDVSSVSDLETYENADDFYANHYEECKQAEKELHEFSKDFGTDFQGIVGSKDYKDVVSVYAYKQEVANVKQEIGEGTFEIPQKLFNSERDFELE